MHSQLLTALQRWELPDLVDHARELYIELCTLSRPSPVSGGTEELKMQITQKTLKTHGPAILPGLIHAVIVWFPCMFISWIRDRNVLLRLPRTHIIDLY